MCGMGGGGVWHGFVVCGAVCPFAWRGSAAKPCRAHLALLTSHRLRAYYKDCDQMGNKGAFITFGPDLVPEFQQYEAVSHPDIRPMAYAQGMGGLMGL